MLALLRVAPLLPSSGRPNRTESNTALPQLLLPRGCEPPGRGIRANPHGAGLTTNLTLNRSAIGDARSLSLRALRRSDHRIRGRPYCFGATIRVSIWEIPNKPTVSGGAIVQKDCTASSSAVAHAAAAKRGEHSTHVEPFGSVGRFSAVDRSAKVSGNDELTMQR